MNFLDASISRHALPCGTSPKLRLGSNNDVLTLNQERQSTWRNWFASAAAAPFYGPPEHRDGVLRQTKAEANRQPGAL